MTINSTTKGKIAMQFQLFRMTIRNVGRIALRNSKCSKSIHRYTTLCKRSMAAMSTVFYLILKAKLQQPVFLFVAHGINQTRRFDSHKMLCTWNPSQHHSRWSIWCLLFLTYPSEAVSVKFTHRFWRSSTIQNCHAPSSNQH